MTASATKTASIVDLFALGYRVRAGVEPLTLIVRNPAGARYIVSPVTETCTCPWGEKRAAGLVRNPAKLCKHLVSLRALVIAEWSAELPASLHADRVRYNRHEDQMFALICRLDAIERAQLAVEFAPVALARAA